MRTYNCNPETHPPLPPTYNHPMWQAWDLALDSIISQLPAIIERNATFEVWAKGIAWEEGRGGEVKEGRGGEVKEGRGGEVKEGRGGEVKEGRGGEVKGWAV